MEQLNQTIRVKFGLAISQLVDVVRVGGGTLWQSSLSSASPSIKALTLRSYLRMRRISEWQPTCGWNRQVELQWTTTPWETSNNINLGIRFSVWWHFTDSPYLYGRWGVGQMPWELIYLVDKDSWLLSVPGASIFFYLVMDVINSHGRPQFALGVSIFLSKWWMTQCRMEDQ